jgi:hypothetical protein
MSITKEEFDGLSAIEKMRKMVKGFSNCNETFLQRYIFLELTKLYRMWLSSEHDFPPDTWTERQVREALRGIVPMWDVMAIPVYNIKTPKFEEEDFLGLPVLTDK